MRDYGSGHRGDETNAFEPPPRAWGVALSATERYARAPAQYARAAERGVVALRRPISLVCPVCGTTVYPHWCSYRCRCGWHCRARAMGQSQGGGFLPEFGPLPRRGLNWKPALTPDELERRMFVMRQYRCAMNGKDFDEQTDDG